MIMRSATMDRGTDLMAGVKTRFFGPYVFVLYRPYLRTFVGPWRELTPTIMLVRHWNQWV